MASVLPAFNSERVLRDYLREFYGPAARHARVIAADGFRPARELGEWKAAVRSAWPGVSLRSLGATASEITFGERVHIEVEVALNGLAPSDVRVECHVRHELGSELVVPVQGYAENRRPRYGINDVEGGAVLIEPFEPGSVDGNGSCRYNLDLQPPWAGTLHFEVHAVPAHPHLSHPYDLGLMLKL
jgi:starch phosphorylase